MAEQQLAPRAKSEVAFTKEGFRPQNMSEAFRFCQALVASGLTPKGDRAETVLAKLQAGAELGFPPMQALASLTVVNGRLGLMGTAALALVRSSGCCLFLTVTTEGKGDDMAGVVRTRRKGDPAPTEYRFSVADAKRAGLWAKVGPWTQYPEDMLQWRAVARATKRHYSDTLLGMQLAEEIEDMPAAPAGEIRQLNVAPTEADPLLDEPEPEPEHNEDGEAV